MSDKKLEARQSGFLSIFGRKESASNARNVPSNGLPEQSTNPPPRRAYKPRHAERDMVLSMPVEQRPDLVAKANEARLQGVCSDIGFNTSASPRSVSGHSRAGSRYMPTHPNLHLKLQGSSQASAAGSSASSFQDSVLQGPGVYRASSSPVSMLDNYIHATNAELSSRTLQPHRPGPRSHHSVAADAQTDCTSIEVINQAFAETGVSGADSEPGRALPKLGIDPGLAVHASHRLMATHATTRQRNSYFSHNNTLPNLRTDKSKGKQGVRPSAAVSLSLAGRNHYGEAYEKDYLDDRESYVIRTTTGPTFPPRAAPSLPGGLLKQCVYDPESSSSSFAESVENSNDFWSRADSGRNPSTSTLMTSYTESSDALASTARSYQLDAAASMDDVDIKLPKTANDSKHGHEEDADSEVESDSNDETPDAKRGQLGELQHDATGKV